MRTNDLGVVAVGNFLSYEGKVIRIDAVHQDKLAYHDTYDRLTWVRYEKVHPIPITKAWLEKTFGVKDEKESLVRTYIVNNNDAKLPRHFIIFNTMTGLAGVVASGSIIDTKFSERYVDFANIKYIHKLQNTFTDNGISHKLNIETITNNI